MTVRHWAASAMVGCALSCAAPNPAFDAGGAVTTGDVATSKASLGDDDGDGDGSPDDGGSTRGDATGSVGSSEDTGPDDEGTAGTGSPVTDSGSSEGGAACSVDLHPLFQIDVSDAQNNPIPLQCGRSNVFTGIVTNAFGPDTIEMETCLDGSCGCASEPQPVTLEFIDLDPSPGEVVDFAASGCIALIVFTASAAEGCGIESAHIEAASGKVDFPLYIATNGFGASSLLLPPISLGEPAELCEEHDCDPKTAPGSYSLFFGDVGPIGPGDSASVNMNPFASIEATYQVFDRFSYIDQDCTTHVGWTAAWTP